MYEVKEIRDNKGMNDFFSVPAEVYRNDPNWIGHTAALLKDVLDPYRNPYFVNVLLKIFVCYRDQKPGCRSILVINRTHWVRWNKKSAFFGFFEASDDPAAVQFLFRRLEDEAANAGADYMEGPFNPNHYSELGILTDNFEDRPVFFESYNPPYYSHLLENAGFLKSFNLYTMINRNLGETLHEKPHHLSGNSNLTVRKFNIFRYKKDLEILREINNDAFEENMYFLPLSRGEYEFTGRYFSLITKPSFILIAEHNGLPVGAVQFVIDFNSLLRSTGGKINFRRIPLLLLRRHRVKELVIFTVGVKKAYRRLPVFAALFNAAIEVMRKYSTVTTTWMSDEKLGSVMARLLELKPYKHFAIYSKKIHA